MELVDQEIEKLLPTFRAAIHCELLNEEEVKDIVMKRKKAEGKLIKREAELRDFIDFVHMDTMIIKLITMRRHKTQYKEKLAEIEYPIVERLNRLLKRAHRLWPQDMNLWQTHINLLAKWNKRTQLSKLYEEFVAMHPHNVHGWLQSARFQVERNGSIEQARKILLRAEMQLPKEPLIWDQLFRVELINAAQLRKRLEVLGGKLPEENESDKDLSMGAAAMKIAELAKKKFPENPRLILKC
ncbi:Oidioi.mRNA.OKI2018_I69.chr2.g5564.t1.cds [Oikopleura dioica]|uniref:Oidioi.mRNA.OKI2018_I69.chr2.g5564.t1.cds n=1 Tax=Oikopleura dioica TaxID=34765 RepID=A0ABN7T2F3_OIKDI|nr:Oidioi.mRNA.OKI2018_I69.chr2.g5564.t1.cds [Oikopleura dioica]